MEGIFQAVYTAGVLLPKPISVCRYVVVVLSCFNRIAMKAAMATAT